MSDSLRIRSILLLRPGLAAGSSIDWACPPQLPSLHMWQNVSGKPCKLSDLIATPEADHNSLCPSRNESVEPGDTIFRRASTETVPKRLLLVRDPVVAFNE